MAKQKSVFLVRESKVIQAVMQQEEQNVNLKTALTKLIVRYIANAGTKDQFVKCVTPEGNMPEWDDAMTLLGMPLDPKRRL